MSSKQMNFALLLNVFGKDKNVPIVVVVRKGRGRAERDGVEIATPSVDSRLFPSNGSYKVTIVSDDATQAIVIKTAEEKVVKQSPLFASY